MKSPDLSAVFRELDAALASGAASTSTEQRAGIVRSVRDGIVHIHGLSGLAMAERIRIPEAGNVEGVTMQLDGDDAYAVLLAPGLNVAEGQVVEPTGQVLGIEVSEAMLGRVVDPTGRPVDGGKDLPRGTFRALESKAPGVMARQPVSEPVQTGVLAVDSMIPIGRGQRELIIGDRQTGKTSLAVDAILNQKGSGMICVYVAIGQREATMATVVERLRQAGAMDYTIVVAAGASAPAAVQYIAPYAGVAIGEQFMHDGKHVLVVYDDLTKHAVAYRELSLLLRRPPGREAYPGDVFYLHSRLLERAAKLSDELGAGSLTALPIIETQAGDVSAYIPTNVISITDGQIFLESNLFNAGVRPAINIGISVSRVGGAAQTKIVKKLSGTAKLDLAQYYELAAFSQFASELDESTKRQLVRGERVVEVMKQDVAAPYKLWEESALLHAVSKGYFDKIDRKDVVTRKGEMLSYIQAQTPELTQLIEQQKALTDEIAEELDKVIRTALSIA